MGAGQHKGGWIQAIYLALQHGFRQTAAGLLRDSRGSEVVRNGLIQAAYQEDRAQAQTNAGAHESGAEGRALTGASLDS
jgi:hypothetical protein